MSIVKLSKYNSDTGCGDLGTQYIMPRDTCLLEVLSEAKKRRAIIVVKTSYQSESRPGQWYIKGFTKGTYESIKDTLKENKKNGLYSTRKAYLIQYS